MPTRVSRRENTSAAILTRAIDLKSGGMPPEGARYILSVTIRDKDKKRALELLAKQQQGMITSAQKDTLSAYIQADNILSILKAKAILALRNAGLKP
jgi:hypothetical protein